MPLSIVIRNPRESDKHKVLSFCVDTFSWGDYIADVWDIWSKERNTSLLVAEINHATLGIAHAVLCLNNQMVWIEGVRVHPGFRRSGIATKLLESCISFGIENGASEALGIVSASNNPSRNLMTKNQFQEISKWSYFSVQTSTQLATSDATFACENDFEAICSYLDNSPAYTNAAKRFVSTWRWYPLDPAALWQSILERKVVITGRPLDGMAIVRTDSYWNRSDVIQITYLDSKTAESTAKLVSFAAGVGPKRFPRMQIHCDQSIAVLVKALGFEESEQFIIYSKHLRHVGEECTQHEYNLPRNTGYPYSNSGERW